MPTAAGETRLWPTFQWSAFLACSWTWCIGMFLPVLLLRDFGFLAYVVFFVPNVLGAAAMGWVIRSENDSRDFVARHLTACRAFSAITAAFQIFFGFWLLSTAGTPLWIPLFGVAVFTLALMIASRRSLRAPVALWVVSAGAFLGLLVAGAIGLPSGVARGELPQIDVLFLTPVVVFGFLLCPYLDMTFHAAAQGAPNRRAAFTLGFVGLFSVMILFTLFYAPLLATRPDLHAPAAPSWIIVVVLAHIMAQLTYTFTLHHSYLGEVRRHRKSEGSSAPYLVLIFGASLLGIAAPYLPPAWGTSMGEQVYRVFMAFYGLVFPAYVWICVLPGRGIAPGPTREKIRIWAFSVGAAMPMFAMGFLARESWWLGPGLAVVLISRMFVPRRLQAPDQG